MTHTGPGLKRTPTATVSVGHDTGEAAVPAVAEPVIGDRPLLRNDAVLATADAGGLAIPSAPAVASAVAASASTLLKRETGIGRLGGGGVLSRRNIFWDHASRFWARLSGTPSLCSVKCVLTFNVLWEFYSPLMVRTWSQATEAGLQKLSGHGLFEDGLVDHGLFEDGLVDHGLVDHGLFEEHRGN